MKPHELKRSKVWYHNSLHGHCAMGVSHMDGIILADTTTGEAKHLAYKIRADLELLRILLKERVEP